MPATGRWCGGLQHRTRQGRADRRGLQAVLREEQGKDLGVTSWPPRRLAERRRHRLGLDLLRPGARPIFYGTANPVPGTPSSAPATTSGPPASSRATPTPARRAGSTSGARTTCTTTTASTRTILLDLTLNGAIAQGARCTPIATATSMSSTAARARCCRPIRSPISTTIDRRRSADRRLHLRRRARARRIGQVVRDICPASPGAKDWNPRPSAAHRAALHSAPEPLPWTGSHAAPTTLRARPYVGAERRRCTPDLAATAACSRPGTRRRGARCGRSRRTSRSGAARSPPRATSSSTARWTVGSRRSTPAAAKLLWQFKTGSGIIGQPVTYRGPDGKQYIAVLSGVGGWAGAIVAGDLDTRDPTAAQGFVNAMRDLKATHAKGGTLYVFALAVRCAASCWRSPALPRCEREERRLPSTPRGERADDRQHCRAACRAGHSAPPSSVRPYDTTPSRSRRASGSTTGSTAAAATRTAAAAIGPALMDDQWLYGGSLETDLRDDRAKAGPTACRRSAAASPSSRSGSSPPMCARCRARPPKDARRRADDSMHEHAEPAVAAKREPTAPPSPAQP